MIDLKFIQLNKNWHKTKTNEIKELKNESDILKIQLHFAKNKIREQEINIDGLKNKIQNQAIEINRLSKLSNKNWDTLKEKFIQFCEKELKK